MARILHDLLQWAVRIISKGNDEGRYTTQELNRWTQDLDPLRRAEPEPGNH